MSGQGNSICDRRQYDLVSEIMASKIATGRRSFLHPASREPDKNHSHNLVTTIRRYVISDSPGRAFRADNYVIEEATILIFGNYLDAPLVTRDIAKSVGAAAPTDHRAIELIRPPVVLIGR